MKNNIPKYWRDGFFRLTGTEPTYEQYRSNPNLWSGSLRDRIYHKNENLGKIVDLILLGTAFACISIIISEILNKNV